MRAIAQPPHEDPAPAAAGPVAIVAGEETRENHRRDVESHGFRSFVGDRRSAECGRSRPPRRERRKQSGMGRLGSPRRAIVPRFIPIPTVGPAGPKQKSDPAIIHRPDPAPTAPRTAIRPRLIARPTSSPALPPTRMTPSASSPLRLPGAGAPRPWPIPAIREAPAHLRSGPGSHRSLDRQLAPDIPRLGARADTAPDGRWPRRAARSIPRTGRRSPSRMRCPSPQSPSTSKSSPTRPRYCRAEA